MVNFEIKSDDIAEYISSHKKELEFNELFFIEYLMKNNSLKQESKIILIQKHNLFILPIEQFEDYMYYLNNRVSSEPTFLEQGIIKRKIDFTGIGYTLLPLLKLKGISEFDLPTYYQLTTLVSEDLHIPTFDIANLSDNPESKTKRLIANCIIAGYLKKERLDNNAYKIALSKNYCSGLINNYEKIYGQEDVQKVKKILEERMY